MEIEILDDTTLKEQLENEMEFAMVEIDLKEREFLEKIYLIQNIVKIRDIIIGNLIKDNRCFKKEIIKVNKNKFLQFLRGLQSFEFPYNLSIPSPPSLQ